MKNIARWEEVCPGPPPTLTADQKRLLKNLLRRKMYDANGTNKTHHGTAETRLILQRVFIEEDHQGYPVVLLLCHVAGRQRTGSFDYVIYTDCLLGPGHVPSDKYDHGTMSEALAAFREAIFYALHGTHWWVIEAYRTRATALAATALLK